MSALPGSRVRSITWDVVHKNTSVKLVYARAARNIDVIDCLSERKSSMHKLKYDHFLLLQISDKLTLWSLRSFAPTVLLAADI